MSLAEIDEEKLHKIEDHVNSNIHLVKSLKCCYSKEYKTQIKFEFLPGHKATILGIKDKIAQMKVNGMCTQKPKKRTTQPKYQSEQELKTMLVSSLDTYAQKQGLPAGIITYRNIVDFKSEQLDNGIVYKCGVSCAFCPKVSAVLYRGYWMKSNATKHIKEHSDNLIAIEEDYTVSS